uniref:Retrovirus-related Pol polyprotein from transposon TNT 1-94-like beta-barrel domain-containing protein n=1 Tax=Fagus sylvatica TaxID=28930 RepID=A0A2N9F5Q7_FAGSY
MHRSKNLPVVTPFHSPPRAWLQFLPRVNLQARHVSPKSRSALDPRHRHVSSRPVDHQLEDIITQALIRAGNASSSSTLSVLPGKLSSWLLDSACCNHMTPYPSFFSHTSSARHAPNIHTVNGSTMLVRSIGTVSTSKLSISDVFHVPQLSYNRLSVGQLAELGYRIILDYYGCVVQDPRTGQELGTGRRIGRLFEISSLRLPAIGVSAATSSSTLSLRLSSCSASPSPGFPPVDLCFLSRSASRHIYQVTYHIPKHIQYTCICRKQLTSS